MKTVKDIEDIESRFKKELTVEDWLDITGSYPGIPNLNYYFWYHISDFGIHVLKRTKLNEKEHEIPIDLDTLTWKDWHHFIPVLRKYFITFREYWGIAWNIRFTKRGMAEYVAETPDYMLYCLSRDANINITDCLNMKYKTFYKLYLYRVIGESIKSPNQGEHYG